VKTSRMQWMMLCAALSLPMTAWAQHGHSPAPSTPSAPQAPESPEFSEQEFDELVALGDDGAAWFAEGDEGGPGGAMHHRSARPGARRAAGRHGGAMGLHMRMANLDLTDAQREKMRDLHEAAMRKGIQRKADLEIARMDLHKLMRADAPSAQSVNTQIDKMAKMRADAQKAHFETFMQARALLTPEQLKQLKEPPSHGGGKSMKMHPGSGTPEAGKP
jgi:Spy/CpxP family protein refolding chaperone